jgi:ammonia channel protein AmtB
MPIDTGDTTWMLVSTGLVMMMTPALGFFEAGLIRAKNSLSIIMQTFSGLCDTFDLVVCNRFQPCIRSIAGRLYRGPQLAVLQ